MHRQALVLVRSTHAQCRSVMMHAAVTGVQRQLRQSTLKVAGLSRTSSMDGTFILGPGFLSSGPTSFIFTPDTPAFLLLSTPAEQVHIATALHYTILIDPTLFVYNSSLFSCRPHG
jgi:hypothetical protein